MMPEMDGYETMREIRKVQEFRTLPMLALTAKAMKGDREKCLEAGASDYVSKPIDMDQLLAVLRVQLDRRSIAADRDAHGVNGAAPAAGTAPVAGSSP
jgi:CheY-like chemotaxis protein